MPITYHRSKDGTVYPVYSGADALAEVNHYYMHNSGRYGYTPDQMTLLMRGQTLPLSAVQRRQIARQQETGCCGPAPGTLAGLDPRTLRVGSVVPGMAVRRGDPPPGTGDRVVGVVPASQYGPERAYLSGGSVVYPHGQARPLGLAFGLVIAAAVIAVVGLAVYARLRFYLAAHKSDGPITVKAPRAE